MTVAINLKIHLKSARIKLECQCSVENENFDQ